MRRERSSSTPSSGTSGSQPLRRSQRIGSLPRVAYFPAHALPDSPQNLDSLNLNSEQRLQYEQQERERQEEFESDIAPGIAIQRQIDDETTMAIHTPSPQESEALDVVLDDNGPPGLLPGRAIRPGNYRVGLLPPPSSEPANSKLEDSLEPSYNPYNSFPNLEQDNDGSGDGSGDGYSDSADDQDSDSSEDSESDDSDDEQGDDSQPLSPLSTLGELRRHFAFPPFSLGSGTGTDTGTGTGSGIGLDTDTEEFVVDAHSLFCFGIGCLPICSFGVSSVYDLAGLIS